MGISLSTTTTTTTNRRRTPTHPYPPPHPMDYYPTYPMNPPPPYPVYSPSSAPVYHPYYNSNAYTVCNRANPLMSQPYFGGPFELQPSLPVAPQNGEQKLTKVVNSDVNVHKDTLRLETDELDPDHYLVSFVFDALLDGRGIRLWHLHAREN